MIEARDLFEVHLAVRDLDVAIGFYRDIVGLTLAHVARGREAAFLWIGSGGNAMLGLWAAGASPHAVTLHTAFRVSVADALAAPRLLLDAGVTPLDFDGRPTELPVVVAWMPAAAVYFRDPDGHLLEYIAMLPHEPRPDCGVVPWRTWELMQRAPTHLLSSSKTRPIELDPTCPGAIRRPCASDQPAMPLITKSGLDQPSTLSSGACGRRRPSDDDG